MMVRYLIAGFFIVGLLTAPAFASLIPGFYPGWQKYDKTPATPVWGRGASASGGAAFTDSTTGMEFVRVKGGCFQMGDTFGDGDNDEKPVHEVCVDDFYIGKYEVTQAGWRAAMGNNPSSFKGDKRPVEKVSWNDVQDYIRKLNSKSGKNYRLPTEAQWEYAARSGGKKEKWAGTSSKSSLGEYAWYSENSNSRTHPVGQKQANGLGLYDMSGNVWEWCSDRYGKDYYSQSPRSNPQGPSTGSYRVFRGGSWDSSPRYLRSAIRYRSGPGLRINYLGFRLIFPKGK